MHPSRNQIIEVAVLHDAIPDNRLEIALDTLVRPEPHQRVSNREVHGITNRDIRKAPTFKSVAGLLLDAISNRVLVGHNAIFDIQFLQESFSRIGFKVSFPYICTLELRRILGFRGPNSLDDLAIVNGIRRQHPFHCAVEDASIARRIFRECLEYAGSQGKNNFRELQAKSRSGFMTSLTHPVLEEGKFPQLRRDRHRLLPRDQQAPAAPRRQHPLDDTYKEGLRRALTTQDFGSEIVSGLLELRGREQLAVEKWRAIHAAALAEFLRTSTLSGILDEVATIRVRQAMRFLSSLGWAPGDR